MPSYDLARERFRLAHPHLAVLGYLNDGEQVPGDLEQFAVELVESGLVSEGGEISPVLSDLVTTLAQPVMIIQVEVTGAQGVLTHGVIIGNEAAFSHEEWPSGPESTYTQIEPSTLVFELARIVNLRKRPGTGPRVPAIESTMGALDVAFTVLQQLPPESQSQESAVRAAREALAGTGTSLQPAELDTFADLIVALRSNWRMTIAWPGENDGEVGTQVAGFGVWDCGELGYWYRELPAEPILEGQVDGSSPLKLVNVPAKQLWEMIAELLPDKSEIHQQGA